MEEFPFSSGKEEIEEEKPLITQAQKLATRAWKICMEESTKPQDIETLRTILAFFGFDNSGSKKELCEKIQKMLEESFQLYFEKGIGSDLIEQVSGITHFNLSQKEEKQLQTLKQASLGVFDVLPDELIVSAIDHLPWKTIVKLREISPSLYSLATMVLQQRSNELLKICNIKKVNYLDVSHCVARTVAQLDYKLLEYFLIYYGLLLDNKPIPIDINDVAKSFFQEIDKQVLKPEGISVADLFEIGLILPFPKKVPIFQQQLYDRIKMLLKLGVSIDAIGIPANKIFWFAALQDDLGTMQFIANEYPDILLSEPFWSQYGDLLNFKETAKIMGEKEMLKQSERELDLIDTVLKSLPKEYQISFLEKMEEWELKKEERRKFITEALQKPGPPFPPFKF